MKKDWKKLLPFIGCVIALVLVPILFKGNRYIILMFSTIGINVIAVSGLDILFGYTGQISMGHAAFYALGAYGSALLSSRLGMSPFITMLIGGLLAALAGALLALPASKLVYHFLSLLTIAFNMLIYNLVANVFVKLTGGHIGITGIPTFKIGNLAFIDRGKYFYIILVVALLLLIAKDRIVDSRTGRAMIAVRENVAAASGMGVNVYHYKMLAFAISAFYAGIAGALYAHMIGYISPDSFTQAQSTIFLTMMLTGGTGSIFGSIIGVVVIKVIMELFQELANYQTLVYGAFILLVVAFLPGGIFSLKQKIADWLTKNKRED